MTNTRATFALVLAALVSTAVQAAPSAREGFGLNRWVPTRPGFAKALVETGVRPIVHGDLNCETAELLNCRVANMPMLLQTNSALEGPLQDYASRYIIMTGAHAGMIAWAEPQLDTPETWYSPSDFANQIMDVGCYVTALTTLEATALANLPSGVHPTGRAATFNDIASANLVPGDKGLNQLEWQYRRWADKLQPNTKDPTQPSSPNFLELYEFASDFGGGSTTDYPNPVGLTAADLIAGMMAGQTYLFAYQRFDVHLHKSKGGIIGVNLTFASQHKVAVSGFEPGKYPIAINDVGDGMHHRVRLTSDPTTVPFTQGGHVIEASRLRIEAPPGLASPVYLVYEGADGINVDNGDELFVLIDYESLFIGPTPRPPHPIVPPHGGTTPY